ncbi:hypothetical protein MKX01_028003 [Papaver californicum]|nr:hypothetical protein MKX01_028003 [Papaver californicum]
MNNQLQQLHLLRFMFSELDGKSVCDNASRLKSECGVVICSLAPLRHKSWTKIPLRERDALIERVKNKFILDTSLSMVKEFLMKSMGRKYTTRGNKMSIFFDKSVKVGTIEDAKKKLYKNVSQEDRDWLCDHMFTSETFKKRPVADATTRKAVLYDHSRGSKSHVVYIEEIQTFYDTHTYITKGTSEVVCISDEARIRWDKINELLQQGNEEGATPPTEAEVCAEVLKRKRRRRRAITTADSNSEGLHAVIQAQAERIQSQDGQICAQHEIIKKLKEDNEKIMQNMQNLIKTLVGNINTDGTTES